MFLTGRGLCLCWFVVLLLACVQQPVLSDRASHKHKKQALASLSRAKRLQHRLRSQIQAKSKAKTKTDLTASVFASVTKVDEYTYDLTKHESSMRSPNAVAWGQYEPTATTHGWESISIKSSGDFADEDQAYAVGYLEGALTRDIIWSFWEQNYRRKDAVYTFMRKQDTYLREKSKKADMTSHDPEQIYWYNVWLTLRQLDGVTQGYNNHSPSNQQLSVLDFWLMNNDGDILDIERAVGVEGVSLIEDMSRSELVSFISINGHCSALIKKTDDELWAAHTTWSDYAELLRIFKHYEFQLNHPAVTSQKSSFSSYPGFISSTDDYYLLDSGVAVIETTLNILDDQLYKHVSSDSTVMAWVRTMVANRLAASGQEWIDLFSKYNSGTYNNQWMVLDYNKYTKGQKVLSPGTFLILEQIPGFIKTEDMTHVLNDSGYWASYNRPFFKEINEKSMYKHYTSKHGEMFSYEHCPRAQIFKRDQGKVKNVEDLKALMQFNDYKHDPLSKGCPGNAIASRFDLEPMPGVSCDLYGIANGATDTKITNSEMAKARTCITRCGPTHDNEDTPPFKWSDFTTAYPGSLFLESASGDIFGIHEAESKPPGQPDLWDFDWMEMKPANLEYPKF